MENQAKNVKQYQKKEQGINLSHIETYYKAVVIDNVVFAQGYRSRIENPKRHTQMWTLDII